MSTFAVKGLVFETHGLALSSWMEVRSSGGRLFCVILDYHRSQCSCRYPLILPQISTRCQYAGMKMFPYSNEYKFSSSSRPTRASGGIKSSSQSAYPGIEKAAIRAWNLGQVVNIQVPKVINFRPAMSSPHPTLSSSNQLIGHSGRAPDKGSSHFVELTRSFTVMNLMYCKESGQQRQTLKEDGTNNGNSLLTCLDRQAAMLQEPHARTPSHRANGPKNKLRARPSDW